MAENGINNQNAEMGDEELRAVMKTVYEALSEKGYNP